MPSMSRAIKPKIDAALREYMKSLSAKGGKKGGKAAWANVSPEERSRRMRDLVKKRWAKAKKKRP